jgi:hypothetical protein
MDNRLALHQLLISIAGPNVYYQAPSTMIMKYPCIKYSRDKIDNKYANDSVYSQNNRYSIIVMSKMADDDIVNKVSMLPKCLFDRAYIQDGIYHNTFNLYY